MELFLGHKAVVLYPIYRCVLYSKAAQVWLGLWELMTQIFEIYRQFISFPCLSFCLIVFHTLFTWYVGNSKDNQCSNSTSRCIPKELKAEFKRYLYVHVCSSTIHSSQKVEAPKSPVMKAWINKMWYTHTMKYAALKRREILTYATRMNLEDIKLS